MFFPQCCIVLVDANEAFQLDSCNACCSICGYLKTHENCIIFQVHLSLFRIKKEKKFALERIWLKPEHIVNSALWFSPVLWKPFKTSLHQNLFCSWHLWGLPGKSALYGSTVWLRSLCHLPPHVYMLSSHGSMTRWVSPFFNPLFKTRSAQKVTFLNNPWVRLVIWRRVRRLRVSEESVERTNEKTCECDERAELWLQWVGLVSEWMRAADTSQLSP